MGKLTHTINGNPAKFLSSNTLPIDSLKVYFSPIQSGEGTPSPTNVRSISGWTGCNIYHKMYDINYTTNANTSFSHASGLTITRNNQQIIITGTTVKKTAVGVSARITADGSTYYISGVPISSNYNIYRWFIYNATNDSSFTTAYADINGVSFTPPAGKEFVLAMYVEGIGENINLDFTPIFSKEFIQNEYPISWNSIGTLYKGYIDLINGQLVQTHAKLIDDGSEGTSVWTRASVTSNLIYYQRQDLSTLGALQPYMGYKTGYFNYLSSPLASSAWKGAIGAGGTNPNNNLRIIVPASLSTQELLIEYFSENPLEIVYELATPIIYQLTPQQINAFLRNNNIWSNTNDNVEVIYEIVDELANQRLAQKQPHLETISTSFSQFNTQFSAPIIFDTNNNITVTRVGKNIYDINTYPLTADKWINGIDGIANNNTEDEYAATLDYIPISHLQGQTLTLNTCPLGTNPGIAFYSNTSEESYVGGARNMDRTKGTPMICFVPPNANYMRFTVPKTSTNIQLEIGTTSTEYKPYSSQTITTGQNIQLKSVKGQNILYSNNNIIAKYWTYNKPTEYYIGGYPILANNVRYDGGNDSFNANTINDNNYFITGFFDSGNSNSKSYTISSPDLGTSGHIRFYKEVNSSSYDWWLAPQGQRTFSSSGRYITFEVIKDKADQYYVYDNTNQKYICRGGDGSTAIIKTQGKEWGAGDPASKTPKDQPNYSMTIKYRFPPLTEKSTIVSYGCVGTAVEFKSNGGTYVDWWTLQSISTEQSRKILSINTDGMAFTIKTAMKDEAYAYILETGVIIFAGKNSIYYKHSNINELN